VPITGGVELRLGVLSEPPRREWSLVIGDCVQNFRSALDHMVWQLAPGTARAANPTALEFPIFSDPGRYASAAPNRIGTISAAAQKIIELAQPFNRPESATDPLWQLHTLSNIDKHRRLHVGDASLEAVTIDVRGTRLQTMWRAAPPALRAQRGMPVARIAEAELRRFGQLATVRYQPSFFLTVAFEDSGDVTGEGVIGTLRRIRERVADVLGQLDPCVALV